MECLEMTNEEIEEYLKDTSDGELIMLYRDEDENAKNLLFYKYKCIIDILVNKYKMYLNKLNVDFQEICSECNVGFSDALNHFQEDKDTSLSTFITLCIERRIKGIIRKYHRPKYQGVNDLFSLDMAILDSDVTLLDTISDERANDPLKNILEDESYSELIKLIKNNLTENEYQVFTLLYKGMSLPEMSKILNKNYKQVDNTIQRVRFKIKKILFQEKK